ncbi:hypothetical protein BKA62DRAFT_677825 [Auriculariales sp. MPI-PUGE-AT-0066]|nr:hypothetical protein BKA62DRAFT_677825 [Auriculariales sp. MPI-PUGE-AT-0066]
MRPTCLIVSRELDVSERAPISLDDLRLLIPSVVVAAGASSAAQPPSKVFVETRLEHCTISGRPERYLRLTTVGSQAQDYPREVAGPISGALTISSRIGNLRVHVHDSSVQIWVQGLRESRPCWELACRGHLHPELSGYVLASGRGEAKPSWVKQDSVKRRARAEKALA